MFNTHRVFIIAAVDEEFGIGKNNALPWRLRKELGHFTSVTTQTSDPHKKNIVIMGRSTWESLPEKFRPLPDRINVVLTRQTGYAAEGATIKPTLEAALQMADETVEQIFIIGGASIYEQAIDDPAVDGMYLTQIRQRFDCDAWFPAIPAKFATITILGKDEEGGISFSYLLYTQK